MRAHQRQYWLVTDTRDCRFHRCGLASPRRVAGWLILGALLLGVPPVFPQSNDGAEYKIKLAFLYNFAQFVEWPGGAFSDAHSPLLICVAGDNPFQGDLEQGLRGRTVAGHPIQIKGLKPGDNPSGCHLLFVRSDQRGVDRLLLGLKGSSVLTVGETKGFAQRGGVINLTREDNKLRFEINVNAAGQTPLRISSRLLALAKIVKEP